MKQSQPSAFRSCIRRGGTLNLESREPTSGLINQASRGSSDTTDGGLLPPSSRDPIGGG